MVTCFLCIFLCDKAFLKAWNDVCGATEDSPTLHAPIGKTYLLNPLKFQGPCKSKEVNFNVVYLFLYSNGKKKKLHLRFI